MNDWYKLDHKIYSLSELRKGSWHTLEYLIPSEISDTGESYWVRFRNINEELNWIGIGVQAYYDIFILNISDPIDRPKCAYCGEYIPIGFLHLSKCYQKTGTLRFGQISRFCSHSCASCYCYSHSDEYPDYKYFMDSGGGFGNLYRNFESYSKETQQAFIDNWNNHNFGTLFDNLSDLDKYKFECNKYRSRILSDYNSLTESRLYIRFYPKLTSFKIGIGVTGNGFNSNSELAFNETGMMIYSGSLIEVLDLVTSFKLDNFNNLNEDYYHEGRSDYSNLFKYTSLKSLLDLINKSSLIRIL